MQKNVNVTENMNNIILATLGGYAAILTQKERRFFEKENTKKILENILKRKYGEERILIFDRSALFGLITLLEVAMDVLHFYYENYYILTGYEYGEGKEVLDELKLVFYSDFRESMRGE